MIANPIIAAILLVALYIIWRLGRSSQSRTLRRPFDYSRPHEDLVVEFTPDRDLSTEAADELAVPIPEADIDFSRYPEFHEDFAVLLARDSETLFAYWEVTFETVDRYARTTGDHVRPRIVLRIYDAQDGLTPRWVDVNVGSRLGNYYLPIPMRTGALYAEIGLIGSSDFWPIARSGLVEVPRSIFGSSRIGEYAARARADLGVSSWQG